MINGDSANKKTSTIVVVPNLPIAATSTLTTASLIDLEKLYAVDVQIFDAYSNPVIVTQPLVLVVTGQGQTVYSTFALVSGHAYNLNYLVPSGDKTSSKCGYYSLSAFLPEQGGLEAKYYTNRWFSGQYYLSGSEDPGFTQIDANINFNWGKSEIIPKIASNFISIEWSGFLMADFTEVYTFEAQFNDGMQLWIDDQLILDYMVDAKNDLNGHVVQSTPISLTAGSFVPFKLRFYEAIDSAFIILKWWSTSQTKQIVPASSFYFYQSHTPISGSATLVETQYTPRQPTGVHQGDSSTYDATSITLLWTAPNDNGCSPITSYKIEFFDGTAWQACGTSGTTVGVASGLPAGSQVQLRVTGLNAIAQNVGIPSETITLTPSSLPGPSTYIQVDTYSASALLLSWDVPANTGANDMVTVPILDYQLEVDEGFGSGFVRANEDSHLTTSFLHQNLIQGHAYTYRIKAMNLMGYGAYSPSFTYIPRDVPAKPPKVPRNRASLTTRLAVFVEFDLLATEY